MSKQYRMMMNTAVVVMSVLVAGRTLAGSLDPTNAPGPTMHTLEDIYQKGDQIDTKIDAVLVPKLWEIDAKLDTIDSKLAPTRVPKTGQTTSYTAGDDGDSERGVAWPVPRFTDNTNGVVVDNLTGLIWTRNAETFGTMTYSNALAACATLNSGEGGLSDGSEEGNWRLPNVRELQSLLDYGHRSPPLPSGHPFTPADDPEGGIQGYYWTSTSSPGANGEWILYVSFSGTYVGELSSSIGSAKVWPVRGGN